MSAPALEGIDELLDLIGDAGPSNGPWEAFRKREHYHPTQRALVAAIADTSPEAARLIDELASRQAGKSFGAGGGALELAEASPGCNIVYVAATYDTCERMGFKPAKALAESFALGCRVTDMQIETPSGCTIYFLGANTEKFIDRLRGIPNLVAAIIDECGIYKSDDLKTMIDTVMPGLRPRRGKLILMGTPSKGGKQGTWYAATVNMLWKHLRMSYLDNDRVPSFADVERLIDEELAALGYTRQSAYFRREYGGPDGVEFVVDLAEKVYQLTDVNLVDEIPTNLQNHCTAGDLGMSANDSLVCGGWNDDSGAVYITDQEEASGQDTLTYAEMVKAHNARRRPMAIAVDPGGLGQKTIKTVKRMHPTIPIEEAVKGPIGLQVRAANEMLQGAHGWRIYVKRGSKLAMELSTPTWVGGEVGKEIDEHGQHSDLTPPFRYLCIKIRQYLAEIAPPPTDEEKRRAAYLEGLERAKRNARRQKGDTAGYEPEEFEGELSDDLDQ